MTAGLGLLAKAKRGEVRGNLSRLQCTAPTSSGIGSSLELGGNYRNKLLKFSLTETSGPYDWKPPPSFPPPVQPPDMQSRNRICVLMYDIEESRPVVILQRERALYMFMNYSYMPR